MTELEKHRYSKMLDHSNLTSSSSNLIYSVLIILNFPTVSVYGSSLVLTLLFVNPADTAAVVVRFVEQLPKELPQLNGLAGIVAPRIVVC